MLRRLLITGAAGALGSEMRRRLTGLAEILRLSDRSELGEAAPNEEMVLCDLSDKEGVCRMVRGCDGILHFGGQSVEAPWEAVRDSNIEGMFNLYEAARKHSCPPHCLCKFQPRNRVLASNRADRFIGARSPRRPIRRFQGLRRSLGINVS